MPHVTINGKEHPFQAGQTVLAALRAAGVSVPALCDDPRLAPIGGCRLCLVEVRGHAHPVAACTAALAAGMDIQTHTPAIEQLRRTQLRLLAQHYPRPDGPLSPANPFHWWIREYGLEGELRGTNRPELVDDSHPCIHVDMSQCIHCFRCVRICEEVAGQFVWKAWDRGDRTEIRPARRTSLRDSDCVSCGACVDTCPSGALRDKTALTLGPPARETRTVCPYCGTGCEMHVGSRDGRIVSIRPVLEAPVNKGHLCVKGRYAWEFVHAADRVTEPMLRRGDRWQTVSWDEAIAHVAERLAPIIASFGPDAVGVLGSSRATNEENYLAQKFARVAVGTNNVDCCARVCHAPTAAGMKIMLGTGAATNSFDDIEQARTILVCGSNATENHPIVGDRIKQAALRGTSLIVIDPRRIELARYARLHLQLQPGTNIPLLNAIAHTIVEEGLFDPAVPAHVEGWDEFRRFIGASSHEQAEKTCGVPAALIRQAARAYATQKPAMSFHGLGVTEHVQGTEGVMCLVNLALLTGNIGVPGSGVNPLRGQNNVQGAAHMGCDPGVLTGSVPLAEHRQRFESVWKAPLPARRGLNLMQMIDAAGQGRLKALWAMGYDVALTNPHADETIRALRPLDLVIVQDLFLTETARLAGTVFLPACSSFEKDGTFMNSERRIQRVRKAIEPPGACLTDWEIICRVAKALGKAEFFRFGSAEQIWDEVRAVWPPGAGITYRRLESGGLQWPCPTEDHPGTTVLHKGTLSGDSRVKLRHISFSPTDERTTPEFPLLLVTGRLLYQFNAGTMTGRSRTAQLQGLDRLRISAEDAARLGIADGQKVRVASRYGETAIAATVGDDVRPGELFATFQSPEVFLNRVTGPHRDRFVQTPEYKVTAVRVEPVA
jgi:formate dehydrogenase major subunit